MGKKSKDKKRGKGAEKTAAKTEKKLINRQKKELAAIGEPSIDEILLQIQKEEEKRNKVIEKLVDCPSRRANFSFIPHPDKDELILFGGEFFDGQKTVVYNDLFLYDIGKETWTVIKAPNAPPPRSAHQMVSVSTAGGQLWLFGGEFISPSQAQFYHYRDLWVYHLKEKKWVGIKKPGGPSARSGHRMITAKKQLIIFGGFADNGRDYTYFNDLYTFSLTSYNWTKIVTDGIIPNPRSACCFSSLPDGKILVLGGYAKEKEKNGDEKGKVVGDAFVINLENSLCRWTSLKQSSNKPENRSGMTMTSYNNKLYVFGGVQDQEEEDDITSVFFKELYIADVTEKSVIWKEVKLKEEKIKEPEKEASESKVEQESSQTQTVVDDGIFTLTISSNSSSVTTTSTISNSKKIKFWPPARMNCGLAAKQGKLFVYGGIREEGRKEGTLNDFYCLDLRKLDEWKTLVNDDLEKQEWFGSESEDDESEETEDESEDNEIDQDNDEEEDDEEDTDEK